MNTNRYFADISSNNHGINFDEYVKGGHIAIAIKASEGTGFVDPDHTAWTNQAHNRHLAVIHYHFGRPDLSSDPAAEAEHFHAVVHGHTSGRDMFALDLERATPRGWQHDPAWSRDFELRFRVLTGRQIALYASRSTLADFEGFLGGSDKPIWDADWSDSPSYAPKGYRIAFRQYTDGQYGPGPHSYAGIGVCDGNRIDPKLYQEMLALYKCPC